MVEKQTFIIKEEQGHIGINPVERSTKELITYGIVNLDKPKGPTSHQVSDYLQQILKIKKAGHSGTLDPGVTGVQPIALGRATRIAQYLLTAPKEYICVMHIHKKLSEAQIKSTLSFFIGKIKQLPPIKSAVKREERVREIYELEILEIIDQDVLFRVKCQAGTYIRKLCHDIGEHLGCGAHMANLRRSQAGPFRENNNLVTLQDLTDAFYYYTEQKNDAYLRYCIQPIENSLGHIAKIWIFDSAIESISNGRDVGAPGISKLENFKKNDTVAVLSLLGELVAIGKAQMSAVEINTMRKGVGVSVEKVFWQH
jgi:H/ACA ribonucleoprotein complex subunit 4